MTYELDITRDAAGIITRVQVEGRDGHPTRQPLLADIDLRSGFVIAQTNFDDTNGAFPSLEHALGVVLLAMEEN